MARKKNTELITENEDTVSVDEASNDTSNIEENSPIEENVDTSDDVSADVEEIIEEEKIEEKEYTQFTNESMSNLDDPVLKSEKEISKKKNKKYIERHKNDEIK